MKGSYHIDMSVNSQRVADKHKEHSKQGMTTQSANGWLTSCTCTFPVNPEYLLLFYFYFV